MDSGRLIRPSSILFIPAAFAAFWAPFRSTLCLMAFVLLVISPPKLPPGFVPGFPLPVARDFSTRNICGFNPLVGSSGLEPPTSRLSGVRSNHLSYEPMSSSAALASAGRPAARPFPFCTLGPSASSRPRLRFTFPASCLQCNWWRISTWWR